MKVMLTGATGFIGGHIMKALVEAGHEVHALVRSEEKLAEMKSLQAIESEVECFVGDMTDQLIVNEALVGCDACVHAAAFTSLDPSLMDQALAVNGPGAEAVLGAAVSNGCQSVIHVSTMSVIFPPSGSKLMLAFIEAFTWVSTSSSTVTEMLGNLPTKIVTSARLFVLFPSSVMFPSGSTSKVKVMSPMP